ncbi:hydrolase [Enterococcus florum]|uniref:Hydrolase n=1 Tax=Enterococcus florum TaxID=2480627 RepID=A0A4P5P5M3_9ENTE|nr:carbon-nitrogen family hydrolase [Enterococcus florum]GCF92990.1 hydrolase [Enterococcus florum]
MKITLIQMDICYGEPEKNFARVERLIKQMVLAKDQLVILPEMWNTGYDLTRLSEIADENGRRTRTLLSKLAQDCEIYLLGGSVAVKQEKDYRNTCFLCGPSGEHLGRYDKVHLFRLMQEEQYLIAGDQGVTIQMGDFKVSPMICYDLRFPEWFRRQVSKTGTDLFVVPAQWPIQRLAAWRKLLQARAIENQSYVVGVNRAGEDPANRFAGHSLVIDPFGEILLELGEQEETGTIEIDPARVAEARQAMPVFEDRRTELY